MACIVINIHHISLVSIVYIERLFNGRLIFCVGRVLNRFSKDVGFLDDLLPYVYCEYLLVGWKVASSAL